MAIQHEPETLYRVTVAAALAGLQVVMSSPFKLARFSFKYHHDGRSLVHFRRT